MTDPDPYRSFAAAQTQTSAPSPDPGPARAEDGGLVRPLLWLLLVISGVANAVTSSIGGISVFVGVGFGLVTLACASALVVHHRRHRRP